MFQSPPVKGGEITQFLSSLWERRPKRFPLPLRERVRVRGKFRIQNP